jgi:hypothetical protein
MTSRTTGRHRRRLDTQQPPSSLLLDYPSGVDQPGLSLNSGIVPHGSSLFRPGLTSTSTSTRIIVGPAFGADPAFGARLPRGPRALRAALARDRRTFTLALSATLAGITAAAVFGSIAPLHSTWMTSRAPGSAGGRPPQASAPWSAAPQGSPSVQATSPGPARRTGQSARPAKPRRPAAASSLARGTGTSSGTAAGSRTGTGTVTGTSVSSAMAKAGPKVQVRYLIDGEFGNGFQGQVQVINHGTQPIAGWQIVIALPDDIVTSISNAGGFVSHGILLMQPAVAGEVVPPRGGTLNVFFVAEGFETTPAACAFNEITCS